MIGIWLAPRVRRARAVARSAMSVHVRMLQSRIMWAVPTTASERMASKDWLHEAELRQTCVAQFKNQPPATVTAWL